MLARLTLQDATSTKEISDLLGDLSRAISDKGAALVRGIPPSRQVLKALVRHVMKPEGPEGLITLLHSNNGSVAATSSRVAAQGMFGLPLHRDGALVGRPTKYIAFGYVGERGSQAQSWLDLVDSAIAFDELSADMRAALTDHAIEYRVPDRRPFPELPEGWFGRDTFLGEGGESGLNIILPMDLAPGEPDPWHVRFAGISDNSSRRLLQRLDAELRASSAFTRHMWEYEEVVVIDNDRILHGASAVVPGATASTIREAISR